MEENVDKRFGINEQGNEIKAAVQHSQLLTRVSLFLSGAERCLSLEHNGSDASGLLAVLLEHKGQLLVSPGLQMVLIISS